MKRARNRRRKLTVALGSAIAGQSWRNATLTIECWIGGETRVAVIGIQGPGDVTEIRSALNSIVANWKRQLEGV